MGRYFAEFASLVLKPGAELRLKSDFEPNLDGLVRGTEGLPLRVLGRSSDVRRDGLPWDADDDTASDNVVGIELTEATAHPATAAG